jgi:polyisoprenoid-binding protein YceI
MRLFRPFIPSLAMLLMASSSAGAQGVLIDKSEIKFVSRQLGANVEGRFRKWKANVDFRPKDLGKSKAEITIDLGSIDLASEESETEIKRPRWFDTGRFPVATFQSTAMRDLGGDRYEIAGKLTLKGTARDETIPIEVTRDASGNSVATGEFMIKRGDFKLGDGQWSDPTVVADEVIVRVRMVLPRAG